MQNQEDKKIEEFFQKYITPKTKILVATSWWSDSMYTFYRVQEFCKKHHIAQENIGYVYADHSTRQTKALSYIQTQANKWVKAYVYKRIKSTKYTEESLRKRRYDVFNKAIKQHWAAYIITGHNLDDRIEWTILNLLRGCHISGFIGMQAMQKHHLLKNCIVLRPLLWLSKKNILTRCKKAKIKYETDPTNKDNTVSKRNDIRNNYLQKLYKLAHKKWDQTSFHQSFINIYQNLEQEDVQNLIKIPKSKARKAKRAYQWDINQNAITIDNFIQTCKKLHINNNLTQKNMTEIVQFLQKNNNGNKYINKTNIIIAHNKIYFIYAKNKFREEQYTWAIPKLTKTISWSKIQRPIKWLKYKGKSRTKRCINQKIPIFWRNSIPLETKGTKIIHAHVPKNLLST